MALLEVGPHVGRLRERVAAAYQQPVARGGAGKGLLVAGGKHRLVRARDQADELVVIDGREAVRKEAREVGAHALGAAAIHVALAAAQGHHEERGEGREAH